MFHAPYWDAIRRDVRARLHDTGSVLHLSSHSFSPELDPVGRVFDVGVLYDPAHAFEAELAEQMMFALRAAGLAVRANQPYSGVGPRCARRCATSSRASATPGSSSRRRTPSRARAADASVSRRR